MADEKRLIEDLKSDSDYLKEIVEAGQVPVPGGGRRVFVDHRRIGGIAERIDTAIDRIKEQEDEDDA